MKKIKEINIDIVFAIVWIILIIGVGLLWWLL